MNTGSEIILVHGLWFGAWAMARLDRQLSKAGFRVRRFRYSSTAGDLQAHATQLQEFVVQSSSDQLHFLSHSLGGLVTLKMLSECKTLPPGRLVLLGSPLDGSVVARRSSRIPGAGKLLGKVRATLERGYKQLPDDRETGMIAGSRGFGLGMLVGGARKQSDGTVAINETMAEGLKDHFVLPVTHTGMLFSKEVARQAAAFFRNGSFDRTA